jgi:hypothetical protein
VRRASYLVPLIALGAACTASTSVAPDHQTSGEMVSVTPFYDIIDDRCAEGATVTVYEVADNGAGDEREVGTDTATADGLFQVDYETEGEGVFAVRAECEAQLQILGEFMVLEDAYLVVEPVLTMEADPTEMEPGDAFTLTGSWCVSQFEDSDPPVVQVTYLDEAQEPIVAESAMPFGETWSLELQAPEDDGTFTVSATCTYDDDQGSEELPVEAADASEPEAYPDVEITVTSPEEPAEPTEPTPTEPTPTPPAETPRALPAQAQPTFTG